MLRARLECTEHNMRDLAKVAEYEHGVDYFCSVSSTMTRYFLDDTLCCRLNVALAYRHMWLKP
eukprot:1789371-Amphidinium_carterae.1